MYWLYFIHFLTFKSIRVYISNFSYLLNYNPHSRYVFLDVSEKGVILHIERDYFVRTFLILFKLFYNATNIVKLKESLNIIV